MNLRPPRPERGALPGCATLRLKAGLIATPPCPRKHGRFFAIEPLGSLSRGRLRVRWDGAGDRATGAIRRCRADRGPAGAGDPARQGRHRRHHRGHRFRRRPALEPHHRRLCPPPRRRRQEPPARARRRAAAGADGGVRQRRAGARLRDGQSDLAEHRRASGRDHVGAGAGGGAGARHRRTRADRGLRRRLRGDDPHRAGDPAQQRGPRLPRARHHRTVRRGGGGRAAVASSTPTG